MTNEADMGVKYRVNRRAFMQYYREESKDRYTGRKKSERRMSEEVGVSHTLLQHLRRGVDYNRAPKTHVNLETARRFEHAWRIPPGLVFVPDVLDERTGDNQAAAA